MSKAVITSVIKEGNKIKEYVVQSPSGKVAKVSKEDVIKYIKLGKISNGHIQVYKGKEIVRVKGATTQVANHTQQTQAAKKVKELKTEKAVNKQDRLDRAIKVLKIKVLMGKGVQTEIPGVWLLDGERKNRYILFIDDCVTRIGAIRRVVRNTGAGWYTLTGGRGLTSCDGLFREGGLWASAKTHFDISMLDTSNVTDMSGMFLNCHTVCNIKGIEHMDTGKVTNMAAMFMRASEIGSLDLNNWDISNVTDVSNFLNAATVKEKVDLSTWKVDHIENADGFMTNIRRKSKYNIPIIDIRNFDFTKIKHSERALCVDGGETAGKLNIVLHKNNMKESTLTSLLDGLYSEKHTSEIIKVVSKRAEIKGSSAIIKLWPSLIEMTEDGKKIIKDRGCGLEVKLAGVHLSICIPDKTDRLSANKIQKIIGDRKDLYIEVSGGSGLQDTHMMFTSIKCKMLDISKLDMANVKDASSMFYRFEADRLIIKGIDTGKLVTMQYMFCSARIGTLEMHRLNTGRVESMTYMFKGANIDNIICDNISSKKTGCVDFSWMDLKSVIRVHKMFGRACIGKSIKFGNSTSAKLKGMSEMFAYTTLDNVDISGLNGVNIREAYGVFMNADVKTVKLCSLGGQESVDIDSILRDANITTLYSGNNNDVEGVINLSGIDMTANRSMNYSAMGRIIERLHTGGKVDVTGWPIDIAKIVKESNSSVSVVY